MVFLPENIFAKIIAGELPCEKVYEDELVFAFRDIAPKAQTHVLICPKQAIVTARDVTLETVPVLGHLYWAAKQIADELDLEGYKLHMNVGEAGGQVVPHVHLHLLSSDYESVL